MLKILPAEKGRVQGVLLKTAMSIGLLLMLAWTASAYTLVFRSGQRLEIPDEFTLTRTTLTYEISPGFNKTLLLTLIDVPATERANHEAAGSFFKHREETQSAAAAPNEPPPRAVRTLTNVDLAGVRQRRVESEQAYEARRKELGLPTVAETRQREDAEAAVVREQIREDSFNRKQEEAYWRGRARDLRAQIAALDVQANYLRGRISELNESALANQSYITGIYPGWPNNRPILGNGQWGIYPGYPNGYPGGYPTARLPGINPARPNGGWGYPNIYGNPNVYGYPNIYGYPNVYGSPNGYGYPNVYGNQQQQQQQQQSDLTYRLDDLLVKRAGLLAQWRQLEDDARDARVPQVWLEP